MSVGSRTYSTERRVSGPSPQGGEWEHGWRKWSAEAAEAHARELAAHRDSPAAGFDLSV